MATTNKGLNQPALNSTGWNTPLNENFGYIDAALGGITSFNVTGIGTTPQTLTLTQYQSLTLNFTGTLSANVTYQVPSGVGGQWIIVNGTAGAHTLTFRTAAAGASVVIASGERRLVYSDGTGVYTAESGAGFPVPATQIAYGNGTTLVGSAGLTYDGTKVTVLATTAATNAPTEVLRLDSQSSGTPAAGIGASVTFAAETAAGVTKDGMQVAAVATDVATGTEDFDFVLKLMAAGAAATEVFRVSSAGIVTSSGFTASGSVRAPAFLDASGGNTATINGIVPISASQSTGMTLLGTLTMDAATKTLTDLVLTDYKLLLCVLNSVSHSGGTRYIAMGGARLCNDFDGSTTASGLVWVTLSAGASIATVAPSSTAQVSSYIGSPGYTNATTSISFALSGAGVFDGGTIQVYGVK